jgi:hypothetical protein
MHEMSEARKKLYEREAKIRKLREGLMPWTRHIPWIVLGFAPRVLCVIGVIAAVAGLSAWAMAFPVAAIALQLAADMPRRRRSHRAMDRIASASTALVVLGVGVVLVVVNGTWLADQTILWPMLEVIGWTVVSVGVWGLTKQPRDPAVSDRVAGNAGGGGVVPHGRHQPHSARHGGPAIDRGRRAQAG